MDLESTLPVNAHRLTIGDAAPDFSLKGTDDKIYSLADFKTAPVLMVVFLSNHCPYSHAAETRLLPMVADMKGRGLAVVAINPNSPDAVSIGELGYSKYNDSFDEMKLYAGSGLYVSISLRRRYAEDGQGVRLPLHAARARLRSRSPPPLQRAAR